MNGWFQRLVKQGFAQRRKQLRKNLGIDSDVWEGICGELRLKNTVRAEEMDLESWIQMTNALDEHPLKHLAQSGDELFDVVDEQNQVISQKSRREVHAEGLKHRATHVFVFNPGGDLFLQKRSHLKDSCPGLWDSSASGHLDVGETYEKCALRELEEELGVGGVEVQKVGELPATTETGWEFVQLFQCQYHGKMKWPAAEVESGAFFPVDLVEKWAKKNPGDFAPGFLKCWQLWKSITNFSDAG